MFKKRKEKQEQQLIRVFVRTRPLNKAEEDARRSSVIDILNGRELVVNQEKRFHFQGVFGPQSTQLDVYLDVVAPLIPEIIAGYNCTVFAYGQTGTGKTYTMAGGHAHSSLSWKDDPLAGCIPRACINIFDVLETLKDTTYTLQVSYTELYNEELIDLLAPNDSTTKLKIYEDPHQKGSVFISGLTEVTACSREDIYRLLAQGAERRKTASTLLNSQSSRSHTVFTVTVSIKELTDSGHYQLKTGKLNLVDLAGSENISRSGAKNARAREASNINQSLLTLGRVMKALVDGNQHIPYRESKLTRMLQDSLGGSTYTAIIATISPAFNSLDETLNTLDYAYRAQNIVNRPQMTARTLQANIIKNLNDELEKLRKDLAAENSGTGVVVAKENYEKLTNGIDQNKNSAIEKKTVIRNLKKKIEDLENEITVREEYWNNLTASFEMTRMRLEEMEEEALRKSEEIEKEKFVAHYYEKLNEEMASKAQELLQIASVNTNNTNLLHKKVDTLYMKLGANSKITKEMLSFINHNTDNMMKILENYSINKNKNKSNITEKMDALKNTFCDLFKCVTFIDKALKEFKDVNMCINNKFDAHHQIHTNILNDLIHIGGVQEKVMSFFKEIFATLNNLSCDEMADLFEKNRAEFTDIKNLLNAIVELLQEAVNSNLLFAEKLNDIKILVVDGLQSIENALREEFARTEETISQMNQVNSIVAEICNNLALGATNLNEPIIGLNKFSSETSTKIKDIVEEHTTKTNSLVDNICVKFTELDSLRNGVEISQKNQSKHANEITENIRNFEQQTQNYMHEKDVTIKNVRECYKESLKKATDLTNELTPPVVQLLKSVNLGSLPQSISSAQDSVSQEAKIMTKNADSIQDDLSQLCNNFSEQVRNAYIDRLEPPKHEGDTPKRKEFKRPSILERNLPRDVILQEFYEQNSKNIEETCSYHNKQKVSDENALET